MTLKSFFVFAPSITLRNSDESSNAISCKCRYGFAYKSPTSGKKLELYIAKKEKPVLEKKFQLID